MPSLLRTDREIAEIYHRHVDTVYRVCYSFMKNIPDTEDMVQDTFLRLMDSGKVFENQRHEKAWLIVTASNLCKDNLKKWWRKHENLDDYNGSLTAPEVLDNPIAEALLKLSPEYKTVVYMYYYEGYTTEEIAGFLHSPHATVRSRLSRARKQLKSLLEVTGNDG